MTKDSEPIVHEDLDDVYSYSAPETEMRACPYCKGKAELNDPPYADDRTNVFCVKCDATGNSHVKGMHREGVTLAIKEWNARYEITRGS